MTNPTTENPDILCQTGQCLCGAVKFRVEGTIIFNQFCHCRACGRARGMTPVHLIGVKGDFSILQGEENTKDIKGVGRMMHAICIKCGGGLYQRPQGMGFYATFPTTFQIESPTEQSSTKVSVPSSLLPPNLLPKYHSNYENRLQNHYDSLPKYKASPGASAVLMTNEGDIIEE
jgi:hypothetical protein